MITGILLSLLVEGVAPTLQPLFELGRTKNANVVVYSAELAPDGNVDVHQPVEAHWVMKAGDGRVEALTELERKLAYGFTAKQSRPGEWQVTLNAFRQRPLTLLKLSDGWRVVARVAGVPSVLQRVFVKETERLDVPEVQSCELWGKSVTDGRETHEVLLPPKRQRRGWVGDGAW